MKKNIYSGGSLDRVNTVRRDPAWIESQRSDPASLLVPVWRTRSLFLEKAGDVQAVRIPMNEAPWLKGFEDRLYLLGVRDGIAHFAIDLSALDDPMAVLGRPDGETFDELRKFGALLPGEDAAMLAFARGICHWHKGAGYCGRCGAPTAMREGGYTRRCTNEDCGTEHYPRTDPAIIVLVAARDKCLLGRQAQWPAGMFSTLAGFLEPGESLEEAVAREVMEETGVKVARLRYHSSQPWPFPSSLMVGFLAEADEASVPAVDTHELETAAWFTRDELAAFPSVGRSFPRPDSIARRLIEDWIKGEA